MLIPVNAWYNYCKIPIKGIIHIGAYTCEEQDAYNSIGIYKDRVIWLEAQTEKVEEMKNYAYNNIKI